jgi:hypothetical protein
MSRPLAKIAGLAALAAAAAGCTRGEEDAAAIACPRPAIINGLESFERQNPAGAGGLAYRAAMENIEAGCRAEGGDLVVDSKVDLLVEPAAGLAANAVELPYFVAVSAPDGQVLDRQDYAARVVLPPGAHQAGTRESFSHRFVGMAAAGAPGYQILYGFALPREEALQRRRQER